MKERNMTGKVVYVGRNTRYGNPIKLGSFCPLCGKVHTDIDDVLVCFKQYLWWRITGNGPGSLVARRTLPRPLPDSDMSPDKFREALFELEGKVLMCPGCGVNAPKCHARILEAAIVWLKSGEIGP
jgi:hypothetical protein